MKLSQEHKQELQNEIRHIFESGENELRVEEMVINFIERRFNLKPSEDHLKDLGELFYTKSEFIECRGPGEEANYISESNFIELISKRDRMVWEKSSHAEKKRIIRSLKKKKIIIGEMKDAVLYQDLVQETNFSSPIPEFKLD